ncbi:outer membrane protein with beta-barrel domain [Mucilaginibacter oryzae]|uniref:Outer membrane protein with beta-barrel domain n=1 Tax=Mucilaginibacter oryzae TaxID=468058 RepID=A0A316HYY8_9SPHI|nr:outer membrane beta-barrel protein [Mucilaginibacter oryzae]PWK80282.1 outer membrane protein with beta-barrel domain [Mucilaginibacter oryzae]
MINRYLVAFVLLFCCKPLFAQRVPAWGGGADQQDLSFGFSFSYVASDFKIDKQANFRDAFFDGNGVRVKGPLNSISSKSTPGFGVGFLTRYRLTDHLEVRTTPSLIFADRALHYSYVDPTEDVDKKVQTTSVDVPLLLKLKSDRLGDFRAYVIGGVKYTQAIGSKKNTDANLDLSEKLVKNVGGFASYEAGIGCDIYFEFFKLSPEIKISNSFNNVLLRENQPYSSPISRLGLHTLMFSLIFE